MLSSEEQEETLHNNSIMTDLSSCSSPRVFFTLIRGLLLPMHLQQAQRNNGSLVALDRGDNKTLKRTIPRFTRPGRLATR